MCERKRACVCVSLSPFLCVCVCVKDKRGELSEHLAFELLPNVKLTTFCLLGFGCENADCALLSSVVVALPVVSLDVPFLLYFFSLHISFAR